MVKKLGHLSCLLIIVASLAGCRPSTEEIGKTVKESMQETLNSTPEFKNLHLTVESVLVIRVSDNSYQGIATVRSNSQSHDIAVSVTADGKNVMWQTAPEAFLPFSIADAQSSIPSASEQLDSNTQPTLTCQNRYGTISDGIGILDYYNGLIKRTYGSASTLTITSAGDDPSSPSYGCVISFQFLRANIFHIAKWIMFPNPSRNIASVAVSMDACELNQQQVLVENKWGQEACMPQFSMDVYNPHYNAISILDMAASGQNKCEAMLSSDLTKHTQSMADIYRVRLFTDISPVGNLLSENFKCSLIVHIPEYNGNMSPDRLAHWFLYPNRTGERIVAVNTFACDVEAKMLQTHPDEAQIPCAANASLTMQ